MVKIIKLIERFGKNLSSEEHWLAAEYKYLGFMRKLLQEAAQNLDKGSSSRPVKEAGREFRQVGRSQRKVAKFDQRRRDKLEEMIKVLPGYAQDFYNKVEQDITVAEAHLTKGSSLFIGDLREIIERIKLDLGVLDKLMHESSPEINRINNYREVVRKEILSLDQHLAEMIRWVGALSVDLQKEEREEKKLRQLAA